MEHTPSSSTLRTPRGATALFTAVALAAAAGCRAAPTDLEPTPAATTAGSEDTGTHTAGDVTLTVEGDAWTGATAIQRAVTPLRVEVHNRGAGDLLVRYQSFRVTSSDGETYAALPPWDVEESETVYVAAHDAEPIFEPAYQHAEYSLAPYYADVYPGTVVYDDYDWDVTYYRDTYGYWADVELPTTEMLSRALPEGVIGRGGWVDGMLYFEHVPADATGLTLHADLRDPATGVVVAAFAVPVEVEQEPMP